jgi:hypothetical protein
MRVAATILLFPLAFCPSCVGCEKEASESTVKSSGVTRCLKGLDRAAAAPTLKETSSIYYEECSDLFSDVTCRDGFRAAARAEPSMQLVVIADACRKGYCPALGAFAFAICKDDFKATPESLSQDWPPLFDAIVAREAGMSAPEVTGGLMKVYVAAKAKTPASAPSASVTPPAASATGAGSAAPGAPGTPAPKPPGAAPHPSAL